ncbi:MAG: tetratricopeptide repeat protein [Candidatus Sulfotelmatobacter sp.]
MADSESSMSGRWTSTQAYVLSVICLLVGVAVGYLLRGSASTELTTTAAPAQTQAAGAPAGMGRAMSPMSSAQQPTPDQMRQMADTQVQPLLEQLASEPNNADLLTKIGNVYYDAQQYPEAVKYYKSALKINPTLSDVRTDMGTAYHFMGQPDRAIQEYDEVLKTDPKHANALFNEGMVKWQDKMDMNGAIAAWKRLLETNPNYPNRDRVQSLIAQAQQHQTIKPGTKTDKPAEITK